MSALFRTVVVVAIIVLPSTASAALDFTEFKQAVTNYFRALGSITNELPTVNSAAGTAKLVGIARGILGALGRIFAHRLRRWRFSS